MKRFAILLLALGACSDQAIIDAAYPDREKFAFPSKDGESVFAYTCAKGDTPEATKKRAAAAHGYLDQRFNAAVDGAAEKLVEAKDRSGTQAVLKAMDAAVEDIVEQTEERYKCLFLQGREA